MQQFWVPLEVVGGNCKLATRYLELPCLASLTRDRGFWQISLPEEKPTTFITPFGRNKLLLFGIS